MEWVLNIIGYLWVFMIGLSPAIPIGLMLWLAWTEDNYQTQKHKQPTADVVPKSEGEWVRQKGSPEAICSNCGREVVYQVIDNKWAFENYCPHCGAKMKGDIE